MPDHIRVSVIGEPDAGGIGHGHPIRSLAPTAVREYLESTMRITACPAEYHPICPDTYTGPDPNPNVLSEEAGQLAVGARRGSLIGLWFNAAMGSVPSEGGN